MDRQTLRDAFARTYAPPGELDPIALREDYQRFVDYRAAHPDAGRHKIATALDLPPGRVRAWLNGAMPDVVRGTNRAEQRNWLLLAGDRHRLLTRLLAGIFAGGSINDRWTPRWSATDAAPIAEYLTAVDAGVQSITRDRDHRGNELEPADFPRVLGRVLVARGAPHPAVDTATLPAYLQTDETAGRAFVETYIACRGVTPAGRNHIQVYEQTRTTQFYDQLTRLVDQHTNGAVTRVTQGVLIHPQTVAQTDWIQT